MKNRIKNYVDPLFSNIHETKQLRELKEEISTNLLDKINDFIAHGRNPDEAFHQAVADLGDMSELIESLKKASDAKGNENLFPIGKKHVIGYVTASAVLLIGMMVGGIVCLQQKGWLVALAFFMPFILVAAPIYIYFGLTQETATDYGMNHKRALLYSLASEILLFGVFASGIEHFQNQSIVVVFSTLMPFVIVSAIIFTYLGLTEKSRRKMDSDWAKQWVDYYSNPQTSIVRGAISGALWIFSIGAFFLLGFTWSWKFSWIVFVIVIGCEPLIEAFFAVKGKTAK